VVASGVAPGACLSINMDDGDGTLMFREYALAAAEGDGASASFACATDGRRSQVAPGELYLYACRCDGTRRPALSRDGGRTGRSGRCFRVNGTDECGADVCDTDTFHLSWLMRHSPACLGLTNGTQPG
jgi:hypothetical protein